MGDLSTDEEDQVLGQMKGYEHKIDNLMNEVGTLKNEVLSLEIYTTCVTHVIITNFVLYWFTVCSV